MFCVIMLRVEFMSGGRSSKEEVVYRAKFILLRLNTLPRCANSLYHWLIRQVMFGLTAPNEGRSFVFLNSKRCHCLCLLLCTVASWHKLSSPIPCCTLASCLSIVELTTLVSMLHKHCDSLPLISSTPHIACNPQQKQLGIRDERSVFWASVNVSSSLCYISTEL